jgi:predicted nucleic acid-binding Zn ribbon protein
MSDTAFKTCPKELCCMKKWGKGKVKRMIGAGAGLIFKGSGFYITDYRSDNYKAGAKKDNTSSSTTSSSTTGDSKKAATPAAAPAPKAESKPAKAKT